MLPSALRPRMSLTNMRVMAVASSTCMKPPRVNDVRSPRNHNMRSVTAILYNMWYPFIFSLHTTLCDSVPANGNLRHPQMVIPQRCCTDCGAACRMTGCCDIKECKMRTRRSFLPPEECGIGVRLRPTRELIHDMFALCAWFKIGEARLPYCQASTRLRYKSHLNGALKQSPRGMKGGLVPVQLVGDRHSRYAGDVSISSASLF